MFEVCARRTSNGWCRHCGAVTKNKGTFIGRHKRCYIDDEGKSCKGCDLNLHVARGRAGK